jgi:hypothetical protein
MNNIKPFRILLSIFLSLSVIFQPCVYSQEYLAPSSFMRFIAGLAKIQSRIDSIPGNEIVRGRYAELHQHFMEDGIDPEKQRKMVEKFRTFWNSYDVTLGVPFDEDFTSEVDRICLRPLREIIPEDKIFIPPLEELHCTVFNPGGINRENYGEDFPSVLDRMADIAKITNAFDIYWEGIAITENGSILLKGYSLDNGIFSLRERLTKGIGRKFNSDVIHISLGRIVKPLTPDELQKLRAWIESVYMMPVGVLHFSEARVVLFRENIGTGNIEVERTVKLGANTARDVWEMLYNISESRVKELSEFSTVKGQTTLEHVKGLVEFEYALSQWVKNKGSLEEGRKIILAKKDSRIQSLNDEKIDEVLEYYKSLAEGDLWVLRFALVMHDIGKVLGHGEDTQASLDISRPVIEELSRKGLFNEEEAKVILALIYLHDSFNTLHFGEALPQKIEKYLAENNVERDLYYRLAPLLYLADVASVMDGKLSDGHLDNAIFLKNPENIQKLIKNWEYIRLFLGFCGDSNIVISFSKMADVEKPEYFVDTFSELSIKDPEGFKYLFEVFLKDTAFVGHAVFIFRYMNVMAQKNTLTANSLIKFLYLLSKIHSVNAELKLVTFSPTDDEKFAGILDRLMNGMSFEEIARFFSSGSAGIDSFTSWSKIQASLNGEMLLIDANTTIRDYELVQTDKVIEIERQSLEYMQSISRGSDTRNISLNILDANLFSGMNDKLVDDLLGAMNHGETKIVLVAFSDQDKRVAEIAEKRGITVVSRDELYGVQSPEEIAMNKARIKYKLPSISSVNVLSSLENISKWRPAINSMMRYIVCSDNVTISGILKMYEKLPLDIKTALEESGITIETIQRSNIVNSDGVFNVDNFKNDSIVEISA